MERHYCEDFKKYCIDSLTQLEKIPLPTIGMYNDYEAILVCFETSSHIEFILKNAMLRLGKKWSYSVVCSSSNYNFMFSICSKISENIKLIKVNNVYDIDKDVNALFHGEKLLFYNENTLIVNENIYDFLIWDYISSKIVCDINNCSLFGGVSLVSKSFASNFNKNNGNPESKIADIDTINKFVSVNTKNPDCFAYYNFWQHNKSWKKEFRINKYQQDAMYNPTHYRILNIDLQTLNKTELLNHFKNFGYYEKKPCYIKNKETHKYISEYCDFDIKFVSSHYLYYNPELSNLTSLELLKHYNTIGKQQYKTAYDKNLDIDKLIDVTNPIVGKCVIFINSSHELNDETRFLYEYIIYLQDANIYDNILILDVFLNEDLFYYYNKLKIKPLFHCNNFVLMRELLDYYNPTIIYANGLNYLTLNIDKFSQDIVTKTVFHFHDSMELIPPTIKNLKNNTIYCTNEKINEHLYNSYGLTNTHVFRPFIRKKSLKEYNCTNLFGNNNIVFGMVGKNNYENGYDIFINLVKHLPQYNFIWVGGGDYDSKFSADNYIQISYYVDVYKYIKLFDYLFVTCRNKTPLVVYKALYMNCPCIFLENKMSQNLMTSGYYRIKDHCNDFNNIIDYIKNDLSLLKKQDQNIKTHEYILENFTNPYIYKYEIELKEFQLQVTIHEENINGEFNWRHYLIVNPDLTEHNILTYETALEHWNNYGKSEKRYSLIRHCDIEDQLHQYNNLKQRIVERWNDYYMEQVIKMKIKGNDSTVVKKFLYDNLGYINLKESNNNINNLSSAISKWIFNDNFSEIKVLPKKNGYLDLSIYGLDINNFDIEYVFKNYKFCWFSLNSLDDAVVFWNVFGKNNNYLSSTENELYQDLCFDWEYYVKANRLEFTNKIQAFLHWNKYGKPGGLIASNVSLRKTYDEFLNNNYEGTIKAKNNVCVNSNTHNFIDSGDIMFEKEFNNPMFYGLKVVEEFGILNNPMLIIDFPNYGGGCEHFINCIIIKYKSARDFIIARSFNNSVHFYLNDESKIEKTYNCDDAIEFIKNVDVNTIFVNSIIGHSENFVNTLFTLDIPIDTITHDYSLLYKFPQGYYHEMIKQLPNCYFPLHKCRTIITQNEKNITLYGTTINENKFVVAELPDYVNLSQKINTNNTQLVIGIMGNISNLKGYYLIEKLVEYAKTTNDIRIVLFGNIPYFDNTFLEKYPYKSIDELNKLLSVHKPNLWLETSLWPETYSYTLTLMMITGLPIFYQKKPYPSVVMDRLSKYDKSYSFDNINWLINNISALTSKKQKWFHTIDTKIYFNEYWDSYFGKNALESKNIVFISSKVIVSTNKFDYSSSRSIYTTEERYEQTLKTIESIRQYIPNSYVILFDNSEFDDTKYCVLNEKCDLFLNVCNDIDIYEYTNNKIYKLYGELAQTAYVLKYISENLGHLKFDNFFKISGRYWINESFNYLNYVNNNNIFKRKPDVTDRRYYYTSFYKISNKKFSTFMDLIIGMFNDSKNHNEFDGYDWEVLLSKKLSYDFIELHNLGITENIAIWKQQTRI
jgi:hypothetical protein